MTISISPGCPTGGVRIAIDRGGTFTDVYATIPAIQWSDPSPQLLGNADVFAPAYDQSDYQLTFKLLSVDPRSYNDAPAEGIRRVLSILRGRDIGKDEALHMDGIEVVRMGTTVATNALLERKGMPFGLVVTRGFRDVFEIGQQARPDLFDLSIANKPKPLYRPESVIEADERVTPEGYLFDLRKPSSEDLVRRAGGSDEDGAVVIGTNGQAIRILRQLDERKMSMQLQHLYAQGVESLAVILLHSSNYPGEFVRRPL